MRADATFSACRRHCERYYGRRFYACCPLSLPDEQGGTAYALQSEAEQALFEKSSLRRRSGGAAVARVITLSNVFAQYHINSFGTTGVATNTTYFRMELLLCLHRRLGQTATGQNMGACDISRTRKSTKTCILIGAEVTTYTAAILLLFLGKSALWHFSGDVAVIVEELKIASVTFRFYWLKVLLEVYGVSIRGAGKVTPPMVNPFQYLHSVNAPAPIKLPPCSS